MIAGVIGRRDGWAAGAEMGSPGAIDVGAMRAKKWSL